jgi:hypothetical protein
MIGDVLNNMISQVSTVLSDTRVMAAIAVFGGIYALNMLGDDSYKIGGTAELFLDKED